METYDAIIIGSGIGGLSAASLLAQLADKRVLVLEQHFKLGGFTHTFGRKGYSWDVGLHYVGQLGDGGQMRGLFDLITRSGVSWQKMPEIFEVFHYPDLTFEVPSNKNAYQAALSAAFPSEAAAIARYFRDVGRAAGWLGLETYSWSAPPVIRSGMHLWNSLQRRLALSTTGAYLERNFKTPELRALLASQWGDYGLPPSESAFAVHALIVQHYLEGGWYPVGGAKRIAESIVPIIEEKGGSCRVNHEVQEILLEKQVAKGVRVMLKQGKHSREETFYAPLVISDAGARSTFERFLPAEAAPEIRQTLDTLAHGISVVTLYLGLNESPETLGFRGENHWLYESYDHDALRQDWRSLLEGRALSAYLSFPSLKDPEAQRHTAEIITFVDYEAFRRWQNSSWKRRGEAYEALKVRLADALLELVERHFPGFSSLVAYQEVSTPLTVSSLMEHSAGSVYGLPATPERYRRRCFPSRTPVKGLLLAGADACSLGIGGALMGGIFAAGYALGPQGFMQIMQRARSS